MYQQTCIWKTTSEGGVVNVIEQLVQLATPLCRRPRLPCGAQGTRGGEKAVPSVVQASATTETRLHNATSWRAWMSRTTNYPGSLAWELDRDGKWRCPVRSTDRVDLRFPVPHRFECMGTIGFPA